MNRPPDRLRQDPPVVRHRPRDVDELRHERVGHALPHEGRRDVEVVVVEEDRRIGLTVELLDDRVRKPAVHGHVALAPGVVKTVVDVRRARKPPEVVLDEPQHRVRDHVVVPVVRRRVVGDEPQLVGGAAPCRLVDRAAVGLVHHFPVLVGHGACDPRDVVVLDEAAERGHQSAAAATSEPVAAESRS